MLLIPLTHYTKCDCQGCDRRCMPSAVDLDRDGKGSHKYCGDCSSRLASAQRDEMTQEQIRASVQR